MAEVDPEVDVAPDSTRPPDPARLPRGVPFFAVIAVAVLVLLVGGAGGAYQGKLSEVQKNDNSSYLPASAESTRAANEAAAFNPAQVIPGFVVFHRDSGLSSQDKDAVAAVFSQLPGGARRRCAGAHRPDVLRRRHRGGDLCAADRQAGRVAVSGNELADHENAVIAAAQEGVPSGLAVYPAGAGGLLVAFIGAFAGLDGTLLLTAGVIVIIILLLVYRSPVLWFFPLFSAALALGLSSMVIISWRRTTC